METNNNLTSVHISARKWFDKINGNTYHNVKLFIVQDDKEVSTLESGMTYGYGEGWDQTALSLFTKRYQLTLKKYPNGNPHYSYLTRYLTDASIPLTYDVVNVTRKKDLQF
jgi:hypothetical protein